jgi:hypothetical protein
MMTYKVSLTAILNDLKVGAGTAPLVGGGSLHLVRA